LASIEIPNSVTRIGAYTFYECFGLTSIEIPSSITSIEEYTFYGCKSLTSIEIPNSVTRIGECAFYDCKKLTNIEIPSSVTSIGRDAFSETPWIQAKEKENPLIIVNNILVDGKSCKGDVIIPSNVTSIVEWAFYDCSSLTTAPVIQAGVTNMHSTFYDCSNLTTAPVIPASVTDMTSTFNGCSNLTTAPEIPANVTSMSRTFYNCSKLTGIVQINSSRVRYMTYCFSNITESITVRVPANSTTSTTISTADLGSSTITIETF
jgi:hypothetical protein